MNLTALSLSGLVSWVRAGACGHFILFVDVAVTSLPTRDAARLRAYISALTKAITYGSLLPTFALWLTT